MKKRIRKAVQFCCMVVLLGLQTLLTGSWNYDHAAKEGGAKA